jgi:hypothetical protein
MSFPNLGDYGKQVRFLRKKGQLVEKYVHSYTVAVHIF